MAKTTVMSVTDDIDGSANAETLTFGYSGATYEIDLSKKNAAALDKLLKPYIDAARKVSGNNKRSAAKRTTRRSAKLDLGAVRAWATENGFTVAERGRISADVIDAYNAAH
jgi:ribosomal protein L28